MDELSDIDVKSWRKAIAIQNEFGSEAAEELWRLSQFLYRQGNVEDLPQVLAVMKALRAIQPVRQMGATVH